MEMNHSQIREFILNHANYINTNSPPHVSDNTNNNNNSLKICVHQEKSAYKESKMITCASDCDGIINHNFQKLDIYRDRFGNGNKLVFSQKVEISSFWPNGNIESSSVLKLYFTFV